jgi:hypothetical protein
LARPNGRPRSRITTRRADNARSRSLPWPRSRAGTARRIA